MSKLCFLHGFLGSPRDWDLVISHLPEFECAALGYPFVIPKNSILIGYSMGGRIAFDFPNPKIVIGAHPGLTEGFEVRAQEERHWMDLLQKSTFEEFLETWYAQPLFATFKTSEQFAEILHRRRLYDPKEALLQLERHPLSKQRFQHRKNTFYLCGEHDLKYQGLYTQLHLPFLQIQRSGHVCHLENPKDTASSIRACLAQLRHF